jgi:hypothetical protein
MSNELGRLDEREIRAYGVPPELLAQTSDIERIAKRLCREEFPENHPDDRIGERGGYPIWTGFIGRAALIWEAEHPIGRNHV